MTRPTQGQPEDLASKRNLSRNSPRASMRDFFLPPSGFMSRRTTTRIAAIVGGALLLFWIWIGGSMTIDGSPRATAAILRFLIHLPGPIAWMLSAFGLGLALVKRIVELHGWQIHVQSEAGKGTIFTVSFG